MDISLHLASLLVTVPVILYADHMGFQYFTGKTSVLSASRVEWAHRLVFVGLTALIITGVIATVPAWEVWFSKPVFYLKLGFVVTLLINGLFIHGLMLTATTTPYAQLTSSQQNTLITSGVLSALGWIASAVIGLFLL